MHERESKRENGYSIARLHQALLPVLARHERGRTEERPPRTSIAFCAHKPGTAAFQPPKEWTAGKPSFRFMGSLHFLLTPNGTMNLVAAKVRRRIFGVRDSIRLVTSAATNRRFVGGCVGSYRVTRVVLSATGDNGAAFFQIARRLPDKKRFGIFSWSSTSG